jgi:hypothetical protein
LKAHVTRSASAAVLAVLACGALATSTTQAARIDTRGAGAPAARQAPARQSSVLHAPSGPPLLSSPGSSAGAQGAASGLGASFGEAESDGADASSSAPASGGDPLVENGLGSPLCGAGAGELSTASRRNCATSGFEAAGAPTGNYGLDVHIDTGTLGFTAATLEQDYLIGPVWMGLVWSVHTLVVALEWCFTLDLLSGSTMVGLERVLRGAQATFTRPWLVLALALASIAAAYNGLVRRRVAETLGQAALMLAMMAGGLWAVADPVGTVGALGRWVDAASVGTLGAAVDGSPANAPRTLAESMGGLFAGVVGAPWCYLEFGDVRWCTEPALLDPRLRATALRLAAAAVQGDRCGGSSPEAVCQALEGEQPRARLQSAALLRAARTNGELFLALPADQAARNSINDRASLLSALCGGSSDATDCHGPTASQAEFRTQGSTAARVGGLLMIALGALGMLLLLGYIALHLLGSELIGLVYLLLAPVAVIAPALGDGGRAAFRVWAARLIGAVSSKLLFSFLLGVVLLLTRTLMERYTLGWWTRWLLVSALWWGAYLQRRRVLGFIHGDRSRVGPLAAGARNDVGAQFAGHARAARHESIARRVQRQLESPLAVARAAQRVRAKRAKPPAVEPREPQERTGIQPARVSTSRQEARMLEREHEQAHADIADAQRAHARIGAREAQLNRIRRAQARAAGAGDTRRAAALAVRAQRVEGELTRAQERLNAARRTASAGERARRTTGKPYTRDELAERSRFLDAQAALPTSAHRDTVALHDAVGAAAHRSAAGAPRAAPAAGSGAQPRPRRDYAALASLAGYGREQYEQLEPRRRREARLQIDRALAQRREWSAASASGAARSVSAASSVSAGGAGEPRTTANARRHGPASGGGAHGSQARAVRPAGDSDGPRPRARAAPVRRESPVMRDAHEVAQRRKRQLGYDR